MADAEESGEYPDSGPFCRHWAPPWDCEELCGRCGHQCWEHSAGEQLCEHADCDCPCWED